MGVEQAFNHLPNEYMKWAMQQRLDFLRVMIDHEDEILKLYQEMGERITKKLYSFGGYDFDRRTIEQMFLSLENERKRIEGLLTQSIDSGMSKAAAIGIEFELNKTVHMLTEAGLKSELIHKAEQSLIGIHHDALKAMWHRKSYGLKLSERIWNTSKKNKDALSDIILEGMATGRNTAEVGKAIEAYIENNKSVLSTMMEGAELKNVPNNIHFLATRLASTEMVSAYGLASDGAALRSPGTVGMKYQLSNAHPCYDICDVICDADDYGLGQGCYPLEQLPQYPFHPFCLCIKTTLEMDPDELIKKLQNWADDPSSEPGIDSWAKGMDKRKIQTFDAEVLMRKNGQYENKQTVDNSTKNGYNKNVQTEIPKTLQKFKTHSEKWEEDVVNRYLSNKEIEKIGREIKTLIDDNEYAIRIDSELLKNVLEDGKFKNQFETKTSGGALNLEYRKKATKQLFGKDAIKDARDYEKYGYLGHKNFIEDLSGTDSSQYGNCIVHLDKTKLKNRVTYTIDDSLGASINKSIIAGDVSNPRANGINERHLKQVYKLITSEDKPSGLTEFSDEIGIRYIELQYHGELKVNYIKEICFTQDLPDKNVIKKLKSKNIKLFKMLGGWGDEELIEI